LSPQYPNIVRSTYQAGTDYNGLELEVMITPMGQFVFINLKSCPISQSHPLITLTLEGVTYENAGVLFEGGQRIKVPDDLACLILSSLRQGLSFEISTLRFSGLISSVGFRS
jgi:hypothetical protein